jgi:GTP cyclohydrolase II
MPSKLYVAKVKKKEADPSKAYKEKPAQKKLQKGERKGAVLIMESKDGKFKGPVREVKRYNRQKAAGLDVSKKQNVGK